MKNVILTPHNATSTAASTKEAMINMSLGAAKGIDDVLQGRNPEFPVV